MTTFLSFINAGNWQAYLEQIFLFNRETPLIFTQFSFWVFFAFVMGIFSILNKKRLARSTFLFAVSLFFYYKTSGFFFLLLIFSTLLDYAIGLRMGAVNTKWKKTFLLIVSIAVNLLSLAYFKYAYFFTNAYNDIFQTNVEVINWLGVWGNLFTGSNFFTVDKILLPVGVSFFTFQTISYSIDVYKGRINPVRNILDFGFYVSYFPQLVAGPIVRANEFVPQIYKPYSLNRAQFGLAVFWILNGLLKKMLIGDYLAVNYIDRVFEYPENYSGIGVVMSLFLYSLQVYADFSGYTDIAIGVAMLMGFRLPINFNSPYKALNVGDFWKRWHISLSTWLKDYLYIPLGGNRKGTWGTIVCTVIIMLFVILIWGNILVGGLITLGIFAGLMVFYFLIPSFKKWLTTNINMMITMVLGGLWHGASWNFFIWGALNGAGLMVYKVWRKISPYENSNHWIVRCWKIGLTFTFITFTRLFFRSGGIKTTGFGEGQVAGIYTAQKLWLQITTNWDWLAGMRIFIEYKWVFLVFLAGMIIHWLPSSFKQYYRNKFIKAPYIIQAIIVIVSVFIVYQTTTGGVQPFIYFQF